MSENVVFSLYNQPKNGKCLLNNAPPLVPKHHLYQRCVSIKQAVCVNGVLEHGGNDVLQTKKGKGPAYSTWNTVIANGKLHQWLRFW